jgi:sulfatase-modifying factor enzyme 1
MHRNYASIASALIAWSGASSVLGAVCPDGMVLLPPGTYAAASLKQTTAVHSFCIDKTEVTAEAYAACVERGNCSKPDAHFECTWGKGKNLPINCVDFNQATFFCAAMGKRLPTEEEWEWAARGGTRGTRYPWGNDQPSSQVCWQHRPDAPEVPGPCLVGSFPGGDSPQGIHDLAGNVSEWTSSVFSVEGESDRVHRVVRGGDYFTWAVSAGVGHRGIEPPSTRSAWTGFRCARDVAPKPLVLASHCAASEKIVLSCEVAGGKVLSVCASKDFADGKGSLQYRFGRVQQVELAHPGPGADPRAVFKYGVFTELVRGRAADEQRESGTYLEFTTAAATYVIFSDKGWQGVRVTPTGGKVSERRCQGTVLDDFRWLEGAGFPKE